MGISSRERKEELGRLRRMVRVWEPLAETEETWLSRPAYRAEDWARRRVATASEAVKADPSEKVTPLRREMVQV